MRSCWISLVVACLLATTPLKAQEGAPPPAPETPPTTPEPPPPEPPPPDVPAAEPPAAPPAAAEPTPAPPAAPTPPPAAAAAPPAPEAQAAPTALAADPEEPTLEEKRLVAYVATGVTVVSLAAGITFGLLAQDKFDCVSDVIACNESRANKIVGEELFDARNDIERTAIAADISYLFAATSALVATVGYLQGFVFVDAVEGAE